MLSDDSEQTAHSSSLIRIFTGHILAEAAKFVHADNEDWSDIIGVQVNLSLRSSLGARPKVCF